jgi:hypothetical protein
VLKSSRATGKKAASAAFFVSVMPRSLRNILFVLISPGSLASCAIDPVTGDSDFVLMTEPQEISLGAREDQNVKKQYALYDRNGQTVKIVE